MLSRPGMLIALAALALSQAGAATPHKGAAVPSSAAVALFQRDWVLMNWGLRFYDGNRDNALSPAEAAPAAKAFRKIADRNRDGRITPEEYRAARRFIIARY